MKKEKQELFDAFNAVYLETIPLVEFDWYGSQTATVMALQFGMVPSDKIESVVKGLKYNIEVEPIVFFDHFNAENQRSQFDYLGELAIMYGLQLPRMLHRGQAIKTNDLLPDLNLKTNGIWAKENPEGMVYRVERKGKVDFLAKWVRSDFEAGKYIIDKQESELIWNTQM